MFGRRDHSLSFAREAAGGPPLGRREVIAAMAGAGLTLTGCFGARTGLLIPDLSRLAFVGNESPALPRGHVRLMQVDRPAPPTDLTGALHDASWPAWSPDGRRLAYARWRSGNRELVVRDLGLGTTEPERAIARLEPNHNVTQTSWGPTGLIAVQQRTNMVGGTGFGAIFTIPAASGGFATPRQVTPPTVDASFPAWTDDGGIVFVDRTAGAPSLSLLEPDRSTIRPLGLIGDEPDVFGSRSGDVIYTRGGNIFRNALGGGAERLIAEGGQTPRFGPSANELVFAKDGRIWISDGAGGGAHPITDGPGDRQPAWSLYVTED
jgi:Tol biopolymer transport system component